jgi:hypothetical protein
MLSCAYGLEGWTCHILDILLGVLFTVCLCSGMVDRRSFLLQKLSCQAYVAKVGCGDYILAFICGKIPNGSLVAQIRVSAVHHLWY